MVLWLTTGCTVFAIGSNTGLPCLFGANSVAIEFKCSKLSTKNIKMRRTKIKKINIPWGGVCTDIWVTGFERVGAVVRVVTLLLLLLGLFLTRFLVGLDTGVSSSDSAGSSVAASSHSLSCSFRISLI